MDLNAQIAELLSTVRIGGGILIAAGVASVGSSLVMLRRLRRLEERQARIEAWQAKHGAPLERLAFEQSVEDPGAAVSVHRGGSRAAPL